ncbi:sugar phosphate isomerase/epimerase [Nocardioides immobilis]|uniref:Sugar phosphate isomerase/epimerase n=1 Tax=Nocardioides immobilis TaxID=2049295 RepID=A0A417Y9H6_9ACTN|nr:sugar phosphate isomerase/epimerase family protein [Nocardioides immobilis]RHW29164.1 sugar phosphate isomerase/epimerase [Nocardioides immobilis]
MTTSPTTSHPTGSFETKFSYATISLPTLSPLEAIDALASAKFAGVEWRVGNALHDTMSSTAPTFLSNNRCTLFPGSTDPSVIAAACREAGLHIVGIGPYLDVNDSDQLLRTMEFAAELGAPQMRLQAPRVTTPLDYGELADATRKFLTSAEALSARLGVRTVLELHHNTIASSASLALRLIEHCDPEHVGVIYDVGNLVWEGYENRPLALQLLGDRLAHIHLKNVSAAPGRGGDPWEYRWSPLDEGFVDVRALLRDLADVGYAGWISLEDLSTKRSPEATIQFNARHLENVLEEWTPNSWGVACGGPFAQPGMPFGDVADQPTCSLSSTTS